jgi:hypothetical protein
MINSELGPISYAYALYFNVCVHKKNEKSNCPGGASTFVKPPSARYRGGQKKANNKLFLFAQLLPTSQASEATARSQDTTTTDKRKRSARYRYRAACAASGVLFHGASCEKKKKHDRSPVGRFVHQVPSRVTSPLAHVPIAFLLYHKLHTL